MRNKRQYALAMISIASLTLLFTGCGRKANILEREQEAAVEAPAETVQVVVEEEPPDNTSLSDSDIETCEKIIEELDQYMVEQNFMGLFKVYEEYKEEYTFLSSELEEQKALYIEQITSLFDEWVGEADAFAVSGDMENAHNKINSISEIINMASHFEELEPYQDILSERLNYYVDYNTKAMPVDILGNHFDLGNECHYKDETESANPGPYAENVYFIDRYGNVYQKYYDMIVKSTNINRDTPYVIFHADSQYDIFHAEFVCHNLMKEYNQFHIEVYGDDTQLYVSDSFTSYNEPMAIDVDITGYKFIKFTAVREDYNIAWGEGRFPSVGLYNASFSCSEVPEFEYYKPQN